jgi:hypothetical protein
MQIQKRTMNWLPRPSLFAEADAARQKRRAQAQADLATSANMASGLIGSATTSTGESINLTLRIAAARIQTTAQEKQQKLLESADLTA